MKRGMYCVVTGMLFFLWACAETPFVYKPVTFERDKSAATEKLPDRQQRDENVQPLTYERKKPPRNVERQSMTAKSFKTVEGPVTISVNRMQLPEFVIYVLGDALKIPFVMDQGVMNDKRVVTFQTPGPLPADQALEAVIGVLEKHELHVEEKAGTLYVLQKPPSPRQTADVRVGRDGAGGGSGDVLQVIPLRHIRAADIEPLVKDMVRGGVQVKPYTRENVLLLHGNAGQMRQAIDFVDNFDVPSLHSKKLMLLRLTYWQPEEFAYQLARILEGMSIPVARTPRDPGPLLVPIRQMSGVLVVAPDDVTMKYILEWKAKLDTAESAGTDDKAYTFLPQYSRASDLVQSIQRLYTTMPGAAGSMTGQLPSGMTSSGYQTSALGFQTPAGTGQTGTGAAGGGSSWGTSSWGSPSQPGTGQTGTGTTGSFSGSSMGGTPTGASPGQYGGTMQSGSQNPLAVSGSLQAVALPNLKIAADNNKNVVIMVCSPVTYRNVMTLLKQLDTQTKQVLIEATIAELTLTDELQYGVEWFINNTIQGGPVTGGTLNNLISNLSTVAANTTGLAMSYTTATANFQAVINAFAHKNKVNILSTPRLTVLDNQEATIQIGQDVPIATGEQTTAASTTTNPTIVRTINYRSLGIILRVKPTINTEGLLTLQLTQEVSGLAGTTGVGDSPIITIRHVNTSVIVGHGQTVALGGLITSTKTVDERKVPILGDIPIIGVLFKAKDTSMVKTELLVLVTPTILTNSEDATRVTDELKKEMSWVKF